MDGLVCAICQNEDDPKRAVAPGVDYCAVCSKGLATEIANNTPWIVAMRERERERRNLERNEAGRPDRKAYAQRVEAPQGADHQEWLESRQGAADVELPPDSLLYLGAELADLWDAGQNLVNAKVEGFNTDHIELHQPLLALFAYIVSAIREVEHKGMPEYVKSPKHITRFLNQLRLVNGLDKKITVRRYQQLKAEAEAIIRLYQKTGEIPNRREIKRVRREARKSIV